MGDATGFKRRKEACLGLQKRRQVSLTQSEGNPRDAEGASAQSLFFCTSRLSWAEFGQNQSASTVSRKQAHFSRGHRETRLYGGTWTACQCNALPIGASTSAKQTCNPTIADSVAFCQSESLRTLQVSNARRHCD